jgi:hypothetical protein
LESRAVAGMTPPRRRDLMHDGDSVTPIKQVVAAERAVAIMGHSA